MITTDQLYQQYGGTSIPSFDGDPKNNGQCEQWYLMVRTKRDGLPVVFGNAIDRWYTQEPQQYDYIPIAAGVYPKKDDYVVWGPGVGSSAGHIDVCAEDGTATGFVGYDSNWEDVPTLRTIQHDYSLGILGYVRVKGAVMGPTQTEVIDAFAQYGAGTPTAQQIKDYTSNPWTSLLNDLLVFVNDRLQASLVNEQKLTDQINNGTTGYVLLTTPVYTKK